MIENLNDSKKISEEKRKYIFRKITKSCVCWSIAKVSPQKIDELSINNANILAIEKAVKKLKIEPDVVLIDYVNVNLNVETLPIINGDELSITIAAASIIAKVIRDSIMTKLSKYYPEYGFECNKGYGTKDHLKSLRKYGPSVVHRVSFKGVLS